jgi:MFS family permease
VGRHGRATFSMGEGITLSVLALTAGGFTVVGASANAPLIRAGLGLSQVGVGAIASVSYLGSMLSSRIGGRTTDRLGPAVVIAVGLIAMSLGVGLAALAPGVVLFFVGVLLAGLGYGIVNPATNVLANPGAARRRGLVMSVKQAGVPLGGILAGAVLPAVGSSFGWRAALIVPLILCAAVGLATGLRGRVREAPRRSAADVVRPSVRLRLPHGFLYGLGMAGAQVSIFAFTTVYLVEGRGLTPTWAGLGVALLLLGGVVGRPLWGWVSDLLPEHRLRFLQTASLLGALSIALVWTVPDALLPLALLTVGLCSVGWNGVYVAAIAEAGQPDQVGWTTGASLTMINLGAMVCPLVTGLVLQCTHSWAYGWSACSLVSLSAVGVIALSRARPEDVDVVELST